MPRLRIHIGHHFFGSGNIGDDLMLAGFLEAIRPWAAELALTCCTAQDIASQRLRFPSVEWLPYEESARAGCIRQCDVWLGLGDTPFQATGGNTWFLDHLVQESAWCREFGRPMHYLGVGVNEREVLDLPQTRGLLSQAERLSMRDASSGDMVRAAGYEGRVTYGADLAHIALQRMRFPAPEEGVLGLVLNFEDPRQFEIGQIAALIESEPEREVRWLVQEVRALPGSETELYGKLPKAARARTLWRLPDYAGSATAADLIAPWGAPGSIFTSRYHGALIGAWMGARTVAFRRSDKVAGAALELGLALVSDLGDTAGIQRALAESQPVDQELLRELADRARACCEHFLLACAGLRPDIAAANQKRRADLQTRLDASREQEEALRAKNGLLKRELDLARRLLSFGTATVEGRARAPLRDSGPTRAAEETGALWHLEPFAKPGLGPINLRGWALIQRPGWNSRQTAITLLFRHGARTYAVPAAGCAPAGVEGGFSCRVLPDSLPARRKLDILIRLESANGAYDQPTGIYLRVPGPKRTWRDFLPW